MRFDDSIEIFAEVDEVFQTPQKKEKEKIIIFFSIATQNWILCAFMRCLILYFSQRHENGFGSKFALSALFPE